MLQSASLRRLCARRAWSCMSDRDLALRVKHTPLEHSSNSFAIASLPSYVPHFDKEYPMLRCRAHLACFGFLLATARARANRCHAGAGAQLGRHRLDAGLGRPGAVHDHSGADLVLCRSGALQERAVGDDAVFRHHIPGQHSLAGLRLFTGIRYDRHDRARIRVHFADWEFRQGRLCRRAARSAVPDHSGNPSSRCSSSRSRSSPRH